MQKVKNIVYLYISFIWSVYIVIYSPEKANAVQIYGWFALAS